MKTDFISREDAFEALEREMISKDGCSNVNTIETHIEAITAGYDIGLSDGIKAIKRLPPADVVEVVRCRDCKHRIVDSNDDWCECTGCDINPDGFCEEGERITI